jgi:hypothetical protein
MCGIGANLGQRTRGYTESVARQGRAWESWVGFPNAYAVGYCRTAARGGLQTAIEVVYRRGSAEVLRAEGSAQNDEGVAVSSHTTKITLCGEPEASIAARVQSRSRREPAQENSPPREGWVACFRCVSPPGGRTAEGVRCDGRRRAVCVRVGVMFRGRFIFRVCRPAKAGLGSILVTYPTAYAVGYFRTPTGGGLRVRIAERHGWARWWSAEVLRAKGGAQNDEGGGWGSSPDPIFSSRGEA